MHRLASDTDEHMYSANEPSSVETLQQVNNINV